MQSVYLIHFFGAAFALQKGHGILIGLLEQQW